MQQSEHDQEWTSRWVAEMGKGYSPSQAVRIADRFVPPLEEEKQVDETAQTKQSS